MISHRAILGYAMIPYDTHILKNTASRLMNTEIGLIISLGHVLRAESSPLGGNMQESTAERHQLKAKVAKTHLFHNVCFGNVY